LERALCKLVSVAPHLNIYHFEQFVIWQWKIPLASTKDLRFKEVAAPELIALEEQGREFLDQDLATPSGLTTA
jgi:hypothetical protein